MDNKQVAKTRKATTKAWITVVPHTHAAHRSRQDVMRAAVQQVAFADSLVRELDALPRLIA